MPKRFSTARGREFGDGMRAALTKAQLSGRAIARIVDWDAAKISDVINGKGGVTLIEVALFLGVCRVEPTERDHLLTLFPGQDTEGWWQLHGACTPIRPRTAIAQLTEAKTLITWHSHAVPVLLRTSDYARALLVASATVPASEVEERLKVHREMQKLLTGGLDCTFYVHEHALRLPVGGPQTHAAQLRHIRDMTTRTHLTVRIVPAAAGAHAGVAGPFTQLKFPAYEPLVLLEAENSSLFIETKDAVGGYDAVVDALNGVSLNEHESTVFIDRLHAAISTDQRVGG